MKEGGWVQTLKRWPLGPRLGLGEGSKGFGAGGGRGTATCVVFLTFLMHKKKKNDVCLKDALWGGGVTHRSWPGGQGGKPRALVAGEGWGGA